jgi:glutamate N-acetyltransferase/amino-acid N-acetyltransferase
MPGPNAGSPEALWTEIADGDVLSVPGVTGAAAAVGLKPSGELDLGLVDAGCEMSAAGVFTQNRLPAAPVVIDQQLLAERPHCRCIAINAGCANAMTGAQGLADARAMAERAAAACGGRALVLSTGVIGVPLNTGLILPGIDALAARRAADQGPAVARAMMTTDTRPKRVALRTVAAETGDGSERSFVVGGVAKGSGMIHPDMATMLALVVTDAPLGPAACRRVLVDTCAHSFNAISVDGDTSTNDTALLLAGPADAAPLAAGSPARRAVDAAVAAVMQRLALAIVRDGEGVGRVARIAVHGAADDSAALRVAEKIACSPLVKTALAGGDPNWGRILAAAANAGVELDPQRLELVLGGFRVFADGAPAAVDQAALDDAFSRDEVEIALGLGAGHGRAVKWTTDLTKRYVEINAEYTT